MMHPMLEAQNQRGTLLLIYCVLVLGLIAESWATRPSSPNAPSFTFFQISDAHVDPEYEIGGDGLQRCVNMSTNSSSTNIGGKWGQYLCDAPMRTFLATLEAMQAVNANPDFILWTGDSVPHWLDYTSVELYDEDMVRSGVSLVVDALQGAFPNTPIFPAIGNHDNFPSDEMPQPPFSDPWFDFIAVQWETLLPPDALATVRNGAYYTISPFPGLRIISFNSIYCDHLNVWALLNQTDHADQFSWLNSTLQAAREAQERVYIIGHIVPTDYFPWCREQYVSMATAYADVIEGHFWGDRHTDEIRVVFEGDDTQNDPVGIMYVCPSIVPFTNHNPTFRMYSYDEKFSLVDYTTYFTMLNNGTQDQLIWQPEYSAVKDYGVSELTPASWADFVSRLKQNQTLRTLFAKYYMSSIPMDWCDDTCAQGLVSDQSWYSATPSMLRSHSHGSLHIDVAHQPADSTACKICETLTSTIDFLLATNQSIPLVIDGILQLCPVLAAMGKVSEKVCWGFTQIYGPYALPVIAREGSAQRICSAGGWCTNSTVNLVYR